MIILLYGKCFYSIHFSWHTFFLFFLRQIYSVSEFRRPYKYEKQQKFVRYGFLHCKKNIKKKKNLKSTYLRSVHLINFKKHFLTF